MNNPEIAVIINSYNRLELLKQCIKTLSNSIYSAPNVNAFAVVIYEAGSSDGSEEWLNSEGRKLLPFIDFVLPKSGDDTSFSAGINAAVAFAKKKYPDLQYLFFFETDNQLLEYHPIVQALQMLKSKERLAACGFTVRHLDGSPAGVGQPFPTITNFVLGKNLVNRLNLEKIPFAWQTNSEGIQFSYVDVVYTSPLLVKITAWCDSIGLDAKVFPFSDCDVDWARRLKDLDWDMGVIKTDAVIHDNLNRISEWSLMRAIHNHRGRLRYFKRHRPIAVLLIWPVLLSLRHFFELCYSIFIRNNNRRKQLSAQFLFLFKTSIKGYQ
jgi:GT2 family glycosyltransferase